MPSYGTSAPPPEPDPKDMEEGPAVDLIRQKIESLYSQEPDANTEMLISEEMPKHTSSHQEFMQKLMSSGKSLAEIQTAWHNYYLSLSDAQKHAVWQEFYKVYDDTPYARAVHPKPRHEPDQPTKEPKPEKHKKPSETRTRSIAEVRKHIANKVSANGKLKPKHHLQSLAFGLGIGSLVVLFLLFGFFNERIIAPFISPSKHVSSTPIIVDPTSSAVSSDPEIIIPKINVEIPVDYTQTSIDEKTVQKSLENGILHYPTTVMPGEHGNAAFFGHSSNNIFNKGKYKFAFVLLKRLEPGDIFYLAKDGKQYTYRVYDKRIVKPDELWVLDTRDRPDTATLITCDPPGTSINRMVITGEQISPLPGGNTASNVDSSSQKKPEILPSNAPSLWSRLIRWLSQ